MKKTQTDRLRDGPCAGGVWRHGGHGGHGADGGHGRPRLRPPRDGHASAHAAAHAAAAAAAAAKAAAAQAAASAEHVHV